MFRQVFFLLYPFLLVSCALNSPECAGCRADDRAVVRNLQHGECAQFPVNAGAYWNTSGIGVTAGERYSIQIIHTEVAWRDGWFPSTPEQGWSWPWRVFSPMARWFARSPHIGMYKLTCTVGEKSRQAITVGGGTVLEAKDGDELLCYANDWPAMYCNNTGQSTLEICHLPR